MVALDPLERLDAQMADVSDVYVGAGWDSDDYIAGLEAGLRSVICLPFVGSAEVEETGIPDTVLGEMISGQCVAHSEGYWLVYQPETDRFLCFWGTDVENLGAHGIFGSPLGCWSA